MFQKLDDVVKTLLIPSLESIGDIKQNSSYVETFEIFFEISRALLSPGEEELLDEKNRNALRTLSKRIDNFYMNELLVNEDKQTAFNQPDWLKIENESNELLQSLKPLVQARERDIINLDLIPSIEGIANVNNKKSYDDWFSNFSEICDFMLLPSRNTINEKSKEALQKLYHKVDTFDDAKELIHDDLINHPEWINITQQATKLLELLKQDIK
ncbi:MAG: hypothetical protein LW832_09370 [Parachlamydia sp.]|jgi:hypothetical protein|nr:hypothetical protein [Parachlamydia sp.]